MEQPHFKFLFGSVALFQDRVGHATHRLLNALLASCPLGRSLGILLFAVLDGVRNQFLGLMTLSLFLCNALGLLSLVLFDNLERLDTLRDSFVSLSFLFLGQGVLQLLDLSEFTLSLHLEVVLLLHSSLPQHVVPSVSLRHGFRLQHSFLLCLLVHLFLGFLENLLVHLTNSCALLFLQDLLLTQLDL